LLAYRPDLKVMGIRGNVDTRLEKVSRGDIDGLITAAAAVIRLGQQDRITEFLSLESFLPAVGQGALGIEVRSGEKETAELVHAVNHEPTWRSVLAERAFLRTLNVGCHAPVAALGTVDGNTLTLSGMVAAIDGSKVLQAAEVGDSRSPEETGIKLAQRMVDRGALEFIPEMDTR
jgi:hydroxymethylbilane synthase